MDELVEVNEVICQARAVPSLAGDASGRKNSPAGTSGQKGGSSPGSRRTSRPAVDAGAAVPGVGGEQAFE